MNNFQWDARFFDPGMGWSGTNWLPTPAISTFRPPFLLPFIPAGPDPQLALATVDVSIDASVLVGDYSITVGSFSDPTNPTINDEYFLEYVIDEGSNSIRFNVIPEPATLAFLVLRGFTALRRRRS